MPARKLLTAMLMVGLMPLGIALAFEPEVDPEELEGRVVGALEAADLESDYAEALAAGLQLIKLSRRNAELLATRIEETRQKQDVILLTCLLDKQTQLAAMLARAEDRLDTVLELGEHGGDVSSSLVVLAVYGQKIQLIAQEAAACASADDDEPKNELESIRAPEVPEDPDAVFDLEPPLPSIAAPEIPTPPLLEPPVVTPPPVASPIR